MKEDIPGLLQDPEEVSATRPLYHEFAWAYDLLFDEDVAPFVNRVVETLDAHGIHPGARILDAGCGTGRYAVALAERDFVVEGVDASSELVAYGNEYNVPAEKAVRLGVGDLRSFSAGAFDAVVCRGVLNDLLDEEDRQAAVVHLSASLRHGGVLVLDVRDWLRTIESVRERPLFEKTLQTGDTLLSFSSERTTDQAHRLLISREVISSGEQRATSTFGMKPWSEFELRAALERAGCHEIAVSSGTRVQGEHSVSDRIFCAAVRD